MGTYTFRAILFLSMFLTGSSIFSTSAIFLNKTGRDIVVESKGSPALLVVFTKTNRGVLNNNEIGKHIYADRILWVKVRNADAATGKIINQVEGKCEQWQCSSAGRMHTCSKSNYHLEDSRMTKKLMWKGAEILRERASLGNRAAGCGLTNVTRGIFYTGQPFSKGYGTNLRFIITSHPNGRDFYLTAIGGRHFSLKELPKEGFVQPGKFMKAAQKASITELLP